MFWSESVNGDASSLDRLRCIEIFLYLYTNIFNLQSFAAHHPWGLSTLHPLPLSPASPSPFLITRCIPFPPFPHIPSLHSLYSMLVQVSSCPKNVLKCSVTQ